MTNVTKKWMLAPLATLANSFCGPQWESAIDQAVLDNEWFTSPQIARAATAIRQQMLQPPKLQQWLSRYTPPRESMAIGIIMAGNLPMVGMADLLATLVSGHKAIVKPSSRDRALMVYICNILKSEGAPIEIVDAIPPNSIDRLIATGSDASRSIFEEHYSSTRPTLLRGSRTSVAVLTPESDYEMIAERLVDDIFAYWGFGCRNVTRLLVPQGFNPTTFISAVARHQPEAHRPFENCYRHLRAREMMLNGKNTHDGQFFILTHLPLETDAAPNIAQLFYSIYETTAQLQEWLIGHEQQLQCVSTDMELPFPRSVAIGRAQSPELWEYADGVDTIEFMQ